MSESQMMADLLMKQCVHAFKDGDVDQAKRLEMFIAAIEDGDDFGCQCGSHLCFAHDGVHADDGMEGIAA